MVIGNYYLCASDNTSSLGQLGTGQKSEYKLLHESNGCFIVSRAAIKRPYKPGMLICSRKCQIQESGEWLHSPGHPLPGP